MFAFFSKNLSTIIVLLVLVAILFLVVFKMIKDKRNGKKSCSCGCGGCPLKDKCHSNDTKSN